MANRSHLLPAVLIFFCLLNGNVPANAETKPIAKGAAFPNVAFSDVLREDWRSYLGISQKERYSLKDMKGTLFIFEVFSTYCFSCPRNIPVFNAVYSSTKNDAAFREKVKIMGIAVGNTENEIRQYNREFKVSYPVLTDYSFSVHKALGSVRVPFTIFVKKDTGGRYTVFATHQGIYDSAEDVMKTLQDVLRESSMPETCDDSYLWLAIKLRTGGTYEAVCRIVTPSSVCRRLCYSRRDV